MQGKIFVDSNIILYFFTNEENKKTKAYEIIVEKPIISSSIKWNVKHFNKKI